MLRSCLGYSFNPEAENACVLLGHKCNLENSNWTTYFKTDRLLKDKTWWVLYGRTSLAIQWTLKPHRTLSKKCCLGLSSPQLEGILTNPCRANQTRYMCGAPVTPQVFLLDSTRDRPTPNIHAHNELIVVLNGLIRDTRYIHYSLFVIFITDKSRTFAIYLNIWESFSQVQNQESTECSESRVNWIS